MPPIHQSLIDTLYNLRVGCVGSGKDRHERPHKPLMLLAALELIDDGLATPEHIPWSKDLCDRFTRIFNIVKAADDDNTPKNPFFYLSSDKIWIPLDQSSLAGLAAPPRKSQFGSVHAEFSKEMISATDTSEKRHSIRKLLVSRYFPDHYKLLIQQVGHDQASQEDNTTSVKPARSSAFAKRVTDLYDSSCAACGLRIKLPSHEVSFVDAAHLIPFSESHNDHPSNGMALCKHHHWAMDRHLISPGPDGAWHVSSIFDKRRSSAESDLLALAGSDIMLPNEEAFYPTERALKWRYEQLLHK
ncbi:HNH endonuclease [Rubritalea profundi]|uniref:Uncharacterized protein n=1 Tax=Rubritalea profundi TaxID=1658618 RepID=A0A2S7TZE7_9BACT|nr:HNH endonuclease [Rubritalea profundi]PQJ27452.1 hypothetical protein BSZ32_02365 [Rubritalea profundi]